MSCLLHTWDRPTEGTSSVKWKGGFSYTLWSVNTHTECLIMKLLLLPDPLSLLCKVWCNTSVHVKQRKEQPAELPLTLSTWQASEFRPDTKSCSVLERKSLSNNYTSPFSIKAAGLESVSMSNWGQRKLPLLGEGRTDQVKGTVTTLI